MSNYYVSLNGDDTNDGSFANPFRTIQYATGLTTLVPGDVIYIRGGIYQNDIINPRVSGNSGHPIMVCSYPGETAILQMGMTYYEPNYDPTQIAILKVYATSGTFTLTCSGYTTSSINYNAKAADIQLALRNATSNNNIVVTRTANAYNGAWNAALTISSYGYFVIQGAGGASSLSYTSSLTNGTITIGDNQWLSTWSGPDANGFY